MVNLRADPEGDEPTDGPDLAALYREFEGKTVQEILEAGKQALFIDLVVKIRAGTASHQEMAILKGVLKDAGMLAIGIAPDVVKRAEQAIPLDLPDFTLPDYMQ